MKIFYDKYPAEYRPNGNITVDGVCGAVTRNWILKFQLDCSADYPGRILVDERVDRMRDHKMKGSISNTHYTLGFLNTNAAHYNPEGFAATSALIPL